MTMAARSLEQIQRSLTNWDGAGWNRFWFAPSDPLPVCALRIIVGVVGFLYVAAFTPDLLVWMADGGLLNSELARLLATGESGAAGFPSLFHLSNNPAVLYCLHVLSLLAFAALALGCYTRVANGVALVMLMSYMHRAPMISGLLEPLLLSLLAYLLLAPSGAAWSFDARRRGSAAAASWTATFALRLIQVHLTAFYLMMAISKLGNETWWIGEAAWWLAARQETRVVNLTFLHSSVYAINALTHFIVFSELGFALAVWSVRLRPFALLASAVSWLLVAALTGQLGFCVAMVGFNLAFVSRTAWSQVLESEAESKG